MHTLSIPLYVDLPKKKKAERFYLNLNAYRNTHYFTLNKAKELYESIVKDIIAPLPKMLKIELTFSLFMGSQRSADLSNICSIVDKFFCDALVNSDKIPDDNYDVISSVNYQFGGIDKNNPRVEVCINPVEYQLVNAEDETMQITIVQAEIEEAITSYIKSQIAVNEDQEITMDLRAGRGAEGYTATINITPKKAKAKSLASSIAANVAANQQTTAATQEPVEEAEVETVAETGQVDEPAPRKGVEIEVDEEGNPVKPTGAPKSLFGNVKTANA